ncbi:MAG: 50S ribosomal protein L5, partial [Tissierellia bacterium]|nr:50S ribosomal protein L5 [Tissierellia bacterium]
MARLKAIYNDNVVPAMMEKFQYKSIMQVPKIEKIILNMGVGEAKENSKFLDNAMEEMTLIAGQKPVVTKAKKSISNFKVREGMSVGCKVTLRGDRMYEFFDKLVNIALPRV